MQNHIAQLNLVHSVFPGQRNGYHAGNISHIVGIIRTGNIQHILGKLGADCAKISGSLGIGAEKIFRVQHRILIFQRC